MAKANGYALLLPAKRHQIFQECIEEDQIFAQPVLEFQHSRNIPLICFVVVNRKITHIALGRRGMSAGTNLRRLNLDKTEILTNPIAIHRILRLVPKRNKVFIERTFKSGGLLTEKGFVAVVEAISQIAPQASSILQRYSRERTERIGRLSQEIKQALAYQKEALITALSIADISRDSVQEWSPPDAAPISFLEGLPSARLREDQMVVHDFMHLPGFDIVRTYPYNAALFESESERLTVILANRLPLEQQTGTDLIYFNETFQSFVMVQYKAMEREDDENGVGHAVFRLPSHQLTEEIARMDALLTELKACVANTAHDGFRLTENPFFLKLCSRLVFNPDDIGLVHGMYLPLDYWKLLEVAPVIVGPQGGRSVTYENSGRYLDNSAFITVVAKAWVGSTPAQSAILGAVIREILETGKALAIAVKSEKQRRTFQSRRILLNDVRQVEKRQNHEQSD